MTDQSAAEKVDYPFYVADDGFEIVVLGPQFQLGPFPTGNAARAHVDRLNHAYAAGRSSRDAEVERLRSALKKIARPALGGKQQQRIAQEALSPDPGGTMGGEALNG